MENFVFSSPTKVIFGKDAEMQVGAEVKNFANKVLLHYGCGSAVRTGLLERLKSMLREAGIEAVELGGVQENPRLSLVREGIEICRRERIEFVLAVGGGSVIDSAKAIAIGTPYTGDVWDFYDSVSSPVEALGVGVILTNPGSSSESSAESVITNCELEQKRSLSSELARPCFALLNPELTYTIPLFQTACDAAGIIARTMTRYFMNYWNAELTDRLCEAIFSSVIAGMHTLVHEPCNYGARSEMMWAASIAGNGLFGVAGVAGAEGASRCIGYEVSALYDVSHGAVQASLFPAWMKFVYRHDIPRFARFAVRVWKVEPDFKNPEITALEGIHRLESFFRSIGLPVRLSDMQIPGTRFDEIAEKATDTPSGTTGNFMKLDTKAVREILKIAR